MEYSTKALVSNVRSKVGPGSVTVTFKAENRPEDSPLFTRIFERGERELELIENYLGGPLGHPSTSGKILVNRDGGEWKIDYAKMQAEADS